MIKEYLTGKYTKLER